MRVVAMFRVSTEKQANEGASLDAQQRKYRELANASRWTTLAEFRGCESAMQAATERRVLQQVLECVRRERPDALYVHEQSRMTRGDELDVALLMRELKERGTKVIVGGIVRDLASIDDRFMLAVQSVCDRAEAERIRERGLRGKREKAAQGKKNSGRAPLGFYNPPPGHPQRGTLQVVPEKAAIVRRIFEMAAAGSSDRDICRAMESSGIASPRGSRWGPTTIQRILHNPAYIGVAASFAWVSQNGSRGLKFDVNNPKAIIVENAHEPIVERALWDAVQSRPKLPRTRRPGLLTGLLYVNGIRYCVDVSRGKSFYTARRNGRGNPWLDLEQTNSEVWAAFASLAGDPAVVASMIAHSTPRRSAKAIEEEIRSQEAFAVKCRKRLDRLIEMRADGEIGKETYLSKTSNTERQLAGLEARVRQLRSERASSDRTQADRVVKAVQTLLAGDRKLDGQQKRRVLRSILNRVDATAIRHRHPYRRDGRGRVMAADKPRWALTQLRFGLVVPNGDGTGHLTSSSGCCADRRRRW